MQELKIALAFPQSCNSPFHHRTWIWMDSQIWLFLCLYLLKVTQYIVTSKSLWVGRFCGSIKMHFFLTHCSIMSVFLYYKLWASILNVYQMKVPNLLPFVWGVLIEICWIQHMANFHGWFPTDLWFGFETCFDFSWLKLFDNDHCKRPVAVMFVKQELPIREL